MSLQRLQQELKIRRNSPQTARSYLYYNADFLRFCRKQLQDVTTADIRNYLEYLADKKSSGSTMRSAYCSLKFYYHVILHTNLLQYIKIPKQDQKITVSLTTEEVSRLILAISNPRHKLLIELIYGSGLRVSEAVRIKYKDLLLDEGILLVREGKGRKDRKTVLAQKFIRDFQDQVNQEAYLFPGRKGHLTVRSVQQILKRAARKANIKKNIYPHLLRHSFATHLDEKKVKTKHIQQILGHKDQKTTFGYIYDSGRELKKIKSPHDRL